MACKISSKAKYFHTCNIILIGRMLFQQSARLMIGEVVMTDQVSIRETREFQRVLDRARREADRLRRPWVGEQHLLLGLIRNENNPAAQVLSQRSDLGQLRLRIEFNYAWGEWDGESTVGMPVQRIINRSKKLAQARGFKSVGPAHLLLALVDRPDKRVAALFDILGIDPRELRSDLMKKLKK